MRKIVHIDMDAFYASVEQRDDPTLRGRPVVVAWKGRRSVVCAASYEARVFGVRSAMPALTAERLCPDAVFVPPDFARYREVTRQLHVIFRRHTELIEPLSLDEAYLDVTQDLSGLPTATEVATSIRDAIRAETRLTASAGIAPNKFLAKIASDWRKPDGQFVVRPHQVDAFLAPLAVGKLPGVGKVTQARLEALGLRTVGDLRAFDLRVLQQQFGVYGQRLHELAHGIDERRVVPERPTQSISAEDTFETDLPLGGFDDTIRRLAAKTWASALKEEERVGRTVVLKLKTRDFRILTRSFTPAQPVADVEELVRIALDLQARVALPVATRFRLVGVGLSNFVARDQVGDGLDLFGEDAGVEDA